MGVWRPHACPNLKFKMADGRHVGKYSKCHNLPTNGPTRTQLGWSHPIMCLTCPRWCSCHGNGRCNGALNILQLWASGGRTREPILMKFGIQVRTTMTVMWSNIKSWRTVVVGKYSKCHNSPANGPLGRNFGGRIPSCSQYWKCFNSSYDGTDWDDSWVVASKQHLCCKTVSLVFWSLLLTAQWTFWFYGV